MNKELARKTFILTDEQKKDLFNQYYYSEKPTTELLREFNLNGLSTSQITYLFDEFVTDVKCEYCGTLMQHEPPTRTSKEKDLYCPSCGHIIHHNHYKYCSCDGCIRKKNKLIKDYIYKNRDCPKKTFGDLNAKLSFILSALLSYGTNSDGLVIYADKLHDNFNLFPNKNITNKAMKYLIDNYFLVLAENNPDQNFQFIENNKIDLIRYNPNYYELWLENDVKESLNHYKYGESKKALWHRINKAETLNYILTIFEKYYIKYYDIYELRQIMEKFVDSFSLLQILNVINFVTRKPAQDIALHNLSRKDAGYQITRHLKNYYYYAIKNNLEIKENGITNYNFSIITKFFYYHILGVDEIGKSKIF